MIVAIIVVLFLVSLFLAVCLHEVGHFVAARRAGVRVEEFGIGMPPRLFAVKRGETTYSVNVIPIGAFVKAAGENDPTVPRGLAGKGPWTRFGVYAAGPLVNFFLAFLLMSAFLGLPYYVVAGNGIMVHSVVGNSSAAEAGIQTGDVIQQIDGRPVHRRSDVETMVNSAGEGGQLTLVLLRNGEELQTTVRSKLDPQSGQPKIGVWLCWNMISQVDEGSPAYQAGIRPGDTVITINGRSVYDDKTMSDILRSIGQGEEMTVVLLRKGEVVSVSLANGGYESMLGVQIRWVEGVHIERERLSVLMAAYLGGKYIVYMPRLIIEAIPLIIKSPDLALVGPIGAGQLTVEVVRSSGLSNILFMASMISLGLGIFNLFPIPPLDGGGMLVALIEGARRGKRLSPRTVRLAYYVGTAFLIAIMVLVTFSDVYRLISGKGFGV